jgi:hypothetical protein
MEKKIESKKKNYRYPGFLAAFMQELKEDAKYLEIQEQDSFALYPLYVNLLILRDKEHKVKNEIGKIFRTCNVLAYRSSTDPISIEDYHQLMFHAHVCAWFLPKSGISYPAKEITATLVYDTYPLDVIKELKEFGFSIEERAKGIYDVLSNSVFSTQIIVIDELEKEKYLFLSAIS